MKNKKQTAFKLLRDKNIEVQEKAKQLHQALLKQIEEEAGREALPPDMDLETPKNGLQSPHSE